MKMIGWNRKLAAALIACLMLFSALSAAMAMPEDWEGLQIGVLWTDENGETQEVLASPVEEAEGCFWVQVPAYAMDRLSLMVSHPDHDYVFFPTSGTPMHDVLDAGMSIDGPGFMVQATEEDITEQFTLYISTQAQMPVMQETTVMEPAEEFGQEPEAEPAEEFGQEPEAEPAEEFGQEPEAEPAEEFEQEPEAEPAEEFEQEPEAEPAEEFEQEPEAESAEEFEQEPEAKPAEEYEQEPEAEPAEVYEQEPEAKAAEYVPEDDYNEELEQKSTPEAEPYAEEKEPEITPMPEPASPSIDLGAYESVYGDSEEETEAPPATPESTPEPVETPIPMGEMINRYGRTTDNRVAIRSEMTKKGKDKNVLKRVEKGYAVYMLQERLNDNGEKWTAVLYEGRVAYMMSEFLMPMTQAESDAYMSQSGAHVTPLTADELELLESPKETPAPEPESEPRSEAEELKQEPEAEAENLQNPDQSMLLQQNEPAREMEEPLPKGDERVTNGEESLKEEPEDQPSETPAADPTEEPTVEPVPTPVETPIPFGEMINRFGTTNKAKVNVRKSPSIESKVLVSQLKTGTAVYMVRETENEAGERWTEVLIKGKTGYILSEFLTVMTGAESEAYMSTLGSPVPPVMPEDSEPQATEIPEATEVPTDTPAPTEEPTPTVKPTDEPTATPAPTEEPTATPSPTEEPTATPAPTEEPTATPIPTEEPTATPIPTEEPTATPVPTEEPTATPTPTEEPTATPVPTEEPSATPNPTEEPTATPTEAPTANHTQEPPQVTGYAITIGDGAYVRNWPSSNSVIMDELPGNKVVFVNAQTYTDGVAWHQVQYNRQTGYIRADMLRMMGENEVIEYLDQMKATPEPTAVITVQPYDPNSLSSYGHTTTTVNFREKASKNSARIRQLKRYAFCLVLGTTEINGDTWYRVTYDGKTGYIDGHYFKQMTLTELESFLGSAEYLEGISGNAATGNNASGNTSSNGSSSSSAAVISAEDQKVNTWKNPDSGIVVSYEPFDPFATPAPLATEDPNDYLDSLVREVKSGVASKEQLENLLKLHYQGNENQENLVKEGMAYILGQLGDEKPTDTPEPSPEADPSPTLEPVQENTEGSGALGWIFGIAAVLAAGGGGYVWYTGQQRKKKAAQAAAQKRAAQVRRQQANSAKQTTATFNSDAEKNHTVRSRTGNYTEQNGRPSAQPTVTTPSQASASLRKPYGGSVENPYGRYSTHGKENDGLKDSYRPDAARNEQTEEQSMPQDRASEYRRPDESDNREFRSAEAQSNVGKMNAGHSYQPERPQEEIRENNSSYQSATNPEPDGNLTSEKYDRNQSFEGEEATYSASYRTEENQSAMNPASRRRNRSNRYHQSDEP